MRLSCIFAVLALAEFRASNAELEALAVLLLTVAHLAVAPFTVNFLLAFNYASFFGDLNFTRLEESKSFSRRNENILSSYLLYFRVKGTAVTVENRVSSFLPHGLKFGFVITALA